jgi:RES domain
VDFRGLLDAVDVTLPPPAGLWRVGRQPDPLRASRAEATDSPSLAGAGNRWDCSNFGVLYFATTLEACFGETLARFRPSPKLAALVAPEWDGTSRMAPGQLPRDWRDRRVMVRVRPRDGCPFLDVEGLKTRQFLQSELALGLAALGVASLDVPEVRGKDRRVTSLIAEWAWNYAVELPDGSHGFPFSGIRYLSRVDSQWECWAVFEDVELDVIEALPVAHNTGPMLKIATTFSLTVH